MSNGQIKTITEMDLQLTEKLTALSVTLEFIKGAQKDGFRETNDHLALLNGKVLKQEKELDSQNRRLSDFESFKESVDSSAKAHAIAEARKVANRSASIRSILVSVGTFIAIGLVAFIIVRYFHFNPFTGETIKP